MRSGSARIVLSVVLLTGLAVGGFGGAVSPAGAAVADPLLPCPPGASHGSNCLWEEGDRNPMTLTASLSEPGSLGGRNPVVGYQYDLGVGSDSTLPFCSGPLHGQEENPCQSPSQFQVRQFDPNPAAGPFARKGAFPEYTGTQFAVKYNNTVNGRICDLTTCSFSISTSSNLFVPDPNLTGAGPPVLIASVVWAEDLVGSRAYHWEEFPITLTPGNTNPPPTPPTARFTAAAQEVDSLTWLFDGSASSAEGTKTITGWDWDFGDNSTHGTGANTSHPYATGGTYPVILTVTDSGGQTATSTRTIDVAKALTVNSAGDAPNKPTAGKACDTGDTVGVGANAPVECTLRAAIQASNAGGGNTIKFAITIPATPTIAPATALPNVLGPVTIDGTTQTGGFVQLANPGRTLTGLQMIGAGGRVTGLVMSGFDTAILVKGNSTKVDANKFGTNPTGSTGSVQPASGVVVDTATGVVIDDNVINARDVGVRTVNHAAGTISANRIGVTASKTTALDPAAPLGVSINDADVWTVADNTIRSSFVGILLRGTSIAGTTISANHVGNANGSKLLGSLGFGIFVDGVPGAIVRANVVTVGVNPALPSGLRWSADILVTASAQYDPASNNLPFPYAMPVGTVTGGNATVESNQLGVLNDDTPATGSVGIAMAGTPGGTVSMNRSSGHTFLADAEAEIQLTRTAGVTVTENTVGLNAAGTGTILGRRGIEVRGSADTTVSNNVIGGNSGVLDGGIEVDDSREFVDGQVTASHPSVRTVIRDNFLGIGRGGVVLANSVGASVAGASEDTTVGPNNVISNNTSSGVLVYGDAKRTVVSDNRIGTNTAGSAPAGNVGDGVSVALRADATLIRDNIIGGNRDAGVSASTSKTTEIRDNFIGRAFAGQALANGTGIVVANGIANIHGNKVWTNQGAGIEVLASAKAVLKDNTTWDNGTAGLDVTGGPAAPDVKWVRATFGSDQRDWIIVTVPGPGELDLFRSAFCDTHDEGQELQPIFTKHLDAGLTTIYAPDPGMTGVITATFTTFDGTTNSMGAPVGKTSGYSPCTGPTAAPDTSGTGIPDVIQRVLGGDPSNPQTAAFPGDNLTPVFLSTNVGRLTNVRPVTRPSLPGLTFPDGIMAFAVSGVFPGGRADVGVTTTINTAFYWKYIATNPGDAPGWHTFLFDSATGLGAEPIGVNANGGAHQWILHLQDGPIGVDDDNTINGTIVDPGGPGDGSVTPPPPTGLRSRIATVAAGLAPHRGESSRIVSAIYDLKHAGHVARWRTEDLLVIKKGPSVFDDLEDAVHDLRKARHVDTLTARNELVAIAEGLALKQYDDALPHLSASDRRHFAKHVSAATRELDRGDLEDAIDEFSAAWKDARP